jgi:hypothetical protein
MKSISDNLLTEGNFAYQVKFVSKLNHFLPHLRLSQNYAFSGGIDGSGELGRVG